jgi:methylmalonyl-CoA mutase C-terminal domain/subunit
MTATYAPRVLLAKTGLDGHWRGLHVVATALRDAGFEVVLAGMARPEEIAAAAAAEDVDLVGLNVGGSMAVAERTVALIRQLVPTIPIFAGGTLPPQALVRLTSLGIQGFPPGSSLAAIVKSARELTNYAPPGPDEGALLK